MNRSAVVVGTGPLAEGLGDGLGAEPTSVDLLGEAPPFELAVFVHHSPVDARPLADTREADWHGACSEQLTGAFRFSQAVHHPLAAAHHGRAVFVVPTFAMAGLAGWTASAASAEGIRVLAKSLAKQWGADGITVNSLAVHPALALPDGAGEIAAATVALHDPALGRIGDPRDDLVPIIELLATPAAGFVTGATLTVDGGIWMAP